MCLGAAQGNSVVVFRRLTILGTKKKTLDFLTFVVFGIELAKLISLFFSVLNRQIKGFSICYFLNGSF